MNVVVDSGDYIVTLDRLNRVAEQILQKTQTAFLVEYIALNAIT